MCLPWANTKVCPHILRRYYSADNWKYSSPHALAASATRLKRDEGIEWLGAAAGLRLRSRRTISIEADETRRVAKSAKTLRV